MLYQKGNNRGDSKDERHRSPHTHRGINLFRHPEEWAYAEELREDDIIDKYRCNEYDQVMSHSTIRAKRLFALLEVKEGNQIAQDDKRPRGKYEDQGAHILGEERHKSEELTSAE